MSIYETRWGVGEERHGGVGVRRHGDAGMSKDKRSKDKRRHAISSPLPAPRVDNQSMSVAGTLVVVLAVLRRRTHVALPGIRRIARCRRAGVIRRVSSMRTHI